MIETETLDGLLEEAAARFPSLTFHSFDGAGARRSAADLARAARCVAAGLNERGVGRGDLVGVLLPNSLELLAVYFGVLRAGAALVPLSVPVGLRNLDASLARLRSVALAAGLSHLVTDGSLADLAAAAGLGVAIVTPEVLMSGDPRPSYPAVAPGDLAVVQYTSGSTTSPKGVALTHGQVAAGVRATVLGGEMTSRDVYCVWLPLSHDMGLMSCLAHVMVGADVHLTSPTAFIKSPGDWLAYFASVGATISAGPNFSFQYLLDDVDDEALSRLDLSRWRLALNGAEVIDPLLLERFTARFARAGFRAECMYPVYGLAEATVAVTFPRPGERPRVDWVDRAALNQGAVVRVDRDRHGARGVVGVGRPVPGIELRIAGATADDRVGEIEVRGPSVMRGYHEASEATREAFSGEWLRTGDLGYVSDQVLFVTGRIKELIKLRGESYFPEDVEALARDTPGVYRHRCVAFGSSADEEIVVVAETDLVDAEDRRHLADAMKARVSRGLQLSEIVVRLVAPRSIPRTTSGKYQRLLLRERLAADEVPVLA